MTGRNRIKIVLGIAVLTLAMLVMVAIPALAADLTWDPNGDGTSDAGGDWLGTGLWNDGANPVDWVSGSDAIIGNGGHIGQGANITLSAPTTVNSLTINPFTSNNTGWGGSGQYYTLGDAAQAITLNNGINKAAGTAPVRINSPIILTAATDMSDKNALASSVGFIYTCHGLGFVSPLIGGWLAERYGMGINYIYSAVLIFGAAAVALLLRDPRRPSDRNRTGN